MIEHRLGKIFILAVLMLFIGLFVFNFTKADNIVGGNYKNVTVRTSVNITNAKPEILSIIVYQETNLSQNNMTLNAGSTRLISCNVSLRDWNGYNDIAGVNATLWDQVNSQPYTTDNNNTHYSNTSCTNSGNGVNYTVNYICGFNVYYYANNGTWNCTVDVRDTAGKTDNDSNSGYIYPLYALNVTDGIDYGNVQVEDFSANRTANVTNFGNRAINISLEGYGVVRGDGLAMNCSIQGNITVDNEKFSLVDVAYGSRTSLTSSPQLTGLTMPKQTTAGQQIINSTYWQLYVPPNPAGNCSGYIIFSAEAS